MTNICLLTDSYKLTHHNMYPEGTEYVYSYCEARTNAQFPQTLWYGLQYILRRYLTNPLFHSDISEANLIAKSHFGSSSLFNREGWEYIYHEHNGLLPIEIKALPEGMIVPNGTPLMTIVNTDPKCYWLTSYLETILMHVWYPSTVATLSWNVKQLFKKAAILSSDSENVDFMLHDFGFRGVSSVESAGLGGSAHLINFKGTDTLEALDFARRHYEGNIDTLAFSVPASEHSIMTSLGRQGEKQILESIIDKYPVGIISVVCDSYNIYHTVDQFIGIDLKDKIEAREGVFVVRPDSGDPVNVVMALINILNNHFGNTKNKKGYRLLNPKVKLIWGDGIDLKGIQAVVDALLSDKWSIDNIVFGMGGGLLQKLNRDTQAFAIKSSAQCRNGVWHDIYKEPIDSNKQSKKGRFDNDDLITVFKDGEIVKYYTFDEIRANAARGVQCPQIRNY
jgi:nicotinamide phosphoribosyltransferase